MASQALHGLLLLAFSPSLLPSPPPPRRHRRRLLHSPHRKGSISPFPILLFLLQLDLDFLFQCYILFYISNCGILILLIIIIGAGLYVVNLRIVRKSDHGFMNRRI